MLPEILDIPTVYALGVKYDADARPWWYYSDGTTLPYIGGGADDGDTDDGDTDADSDTDDGDDPKDDGGDSDTDDGDDEPLGPKGKKALDAEKSRRRKEAERRRSAETRARELEREVEKLKQSDSKDKDAPDPDAIREEARREAQRDSLRDRTLDRIEARAGRGFEDPEDARALLARRVDDFIDGEEIDNDAINEALDELLEKKPHLGKGKRGGKRFDGGGDGGAKPDKKKRAGSLEEAISRQMAGKT